MTKFKINVAEFTKALKALKSLCSKKKNHPILNYVLIVSEESQVFLYATDLKVSVRIAVKGAEVTKPGTVLLHHKKLLNTLLKIKEKSVELDCDKILAGSLSVCQKSENVEKFPKFSPHDLAEQGFSCELSNLEDCLKKAKTGTTTSKGRYDMSVIRLVNVEDRALFVSTDGKRLVLVKIPSSVKSFPEVSLPKNFYDRVLDYASCFKSDEIVYICVNKRYNEIVLANDTILIQSKLSETPFPPHEKVTPKSFEGEVWIENQKEFNKKLERISKFCDPKNQKVDMEFCDNSISFTVHDEDANESKDSMQVSNSINLRVRVLINYNFLLDHLKLSSNQLLIKVVKSDTEDYQCRNLFLISENFQTYCLGVKF